MGRVRVLVLLLSLLSLSGCFGLIGGGRSGATLTGTVRIDAAPADSQASILLQSRAARISGGPRGPAALSLEPPPGFVSGRHDLVEVILYADRLSADEAKELAERTGFEYLRSSRDGYYVLRDRLGRPESQAIKELQGTARGARVEPNRPIGLLAAVNDPLFPEQWALEMINAVAAWEAARWDTEPVIVAIVDTGIDFNHPDLAHGDLWVPGRDFADAPGEDGIPYGPGVNDAKKAHNHGTMVAGIVAALSNNKVGVAGTVGPVANVKLMPVRVFGGQRSDQETVARAIEWAADNGADVINLSLGDSQCRSTSECPQPSPRLQRALDHAWREGAVVVAAAGNNYGAVIYPANYRTVIAVGSLMADGGKAAYSASGEELDVMAPGGLNKEDDCIANVVSLRAGGLYKCDDSGTSIAAPHVSGIAAMMIARYRSLGLDYGPDDIRQILQITATGMGSSSWDPKTGYGVVNAHAALTTGVPQVFVAEREGGTLKAQGAPVRSQLGGVFRITGVPEGTWTLYAWVDADQSGTVSEGDYFAEHKKQVVARKGRLITGLDMVLTRYEGDDELSVSW